MQETTSEGITFQNAIHKLLLLKQDHARLASLNLAKEEALLTLTSQLDQIRDSLNQSQEAIDSTSEIINSQKIVIDELRELNQKITEKEIRTRESVTKTKRELQEKYRNEEEIFRKSLNDKDLELKKWQKKFASVEKDRDQIRHRFENTLRKLKDKFADDCKKAEEKNQERVEELGNKLRSLKGYYDSEVKAKDDKIKKLEEDVKLLKNNIKSSSLSNASDLNFGKPKLTSRRRGKMKKDADLEFLEECISERSSNKSRKSQTSAKKRVEMEEIAFAHKSTGDLDNQSNLDSSLEANIVNVNAAPETSKPKRVKLLRNPEMDNLDDL